MKTIIILTFIIHSFSLFSKDCFEIGISKNADALNYFNEENLSPDKENYIISDSKPNKFSVFNLKTQTIQEYDKPNNAKVKWVNDNQLMVYTPDRVGESYYGNENGGFYGNYGGYGINPTSAKDKIDIIKNRKVSLVDIKTNTTTEHNGTRYIDGKFYTPISSSEDIVNLSSSDGSVLKWNTGIDRSLVKIGTSKSLKAEDISAYADNVNKKLIINKNGFKQQEIDIKANKVTFTPDGKKIIIQSDQVANNEDFIIYDLEKKTQQVVTLPRSNINDFTNKNKYSKDGKNLILSNASKDSFQILELSTGKIKVIPTTESNLSYIKNLKFDQAGNICGMKTEYLQRSSYGSATSFSFTYKCFDPISGNLITSFKIPMNPQGAAATPISEKHILINEQSYDPQVGYKLSVKLFSSNQICTEKIEPITCDCENKSTKSKDLEFKNFKEIVLKTACSKDYDPKDWVGLTPKKDEKLDEAGAYYLLKRFSKPKGFEPNEDLGLLVGMIDSKMYQKYPSEFKGALLGILNKNAPLYEELISRYPKLKALSGSEVLSCLSDTEKDKIQVNTYEYVMAKSKNVKKANDLDDSLDLVKDTLTTAQKEGLSEKMTEELVRSISQTSLLNGIFPSKIYKFVINNLLKKMDMPNKDITDLTVVRNNGFVKVISLGVKPFEGATLTDGGFNIKPIEEFIEADIPGGVSKKDYSWNYGDKNYSAKINLTKALTDKGIAPANPGPNYEAMWKNKTFKGLVIAGSNMGPELTEQVMQEYIEYYTEKGFTFDKKPKDISNLSEFIKESVSGNQPTHYFIKEAHSDGDEKNLFRITKEGKVLHGIKKVGGKTEMVDLVFPTDSRDTQLISNSDFGQWIKEREKKGGPELIYLNTSCWSATKAVYEISAASSPKLINIPSTTMMSTFTNDDGNVMMLALDGIRNKKNYQQLRDDFKKDKDYVNNSSNVLIFPDEPKYQTAIRNLVKIPIEIDTKIFEEVNNKKVAYSIEATH